MLINNRGLTTAAVVLHIVIRLIVSNSRLINARIPPMPALPMETQTTKAALSLKAVVQRQKPGRKTAERILPRLSFAVHESEEEPGNLKVVSRACIPSSNSFL